MAGMPSDDDRVRIAAGPSDGAAPWRLLPFSILFHLLLLATAMLVAPQRSLPISSEQTVSVEILLEPAPVAKPVAPAAREEQPGGESVPAPDPVRQQPQTTAGQTARDGEVVRAKTMLAAHALADPRSRKARDEWRQLYPDERIIQLCNLEAMEQVHAWRPQFDPDFVVAYAMDDIKLADVTLDAEGAALRDHGNWYNIRYKCEVAADMEAVVAFEFALGDAIPESEWAEHLLASDDGPED